MVQSLLELVLLVVQSSLSPGNTGIFNRKLLDQIAMTKGFSPRLDRSERVHMVICRGGVSAHAAWMSACLHLVGFTQCSR